MYPSLAALHSGMKQLGLHLHFNSLALGVFKSTLTDTSLTGWACMSFGCRCLDGVEALLLTLMQLELWQWTWKKMCPMCPACLHTHSMATAKPGNNQYYHLNGLQGIDCALGLGGWHLLVGPGWIDCEWKLARAQASI